MAQKSVSKSVRNPIPPGLQPFKQGVRDPRQGRGPKKGAPNAGRPPALWLNELRALRDDPACMGRLSSILTGGVSDDATFLKALQWVTERLDGKPVQPVAGAQDEAPVLLLESVAEYKRRNKLG